MTTTDNTKTITDDEATMLAALVAAGRGDGNGPDDVADVADVKEVETDE